MLDKKVIITYWKKKKRTGNVLPKEEGKVNGGREERYHSVPLKTSLCWLTILGISVPSIIFWKCFVYLIRKATEEEAVKQNKRVLLLCACMVGKPCSSRAELKKWMQCLKSRDKTVLEKKKKSLVVEWAIVWDGASSTAGQLQDEVQCNGFHSYKNILQSSCMHVPKGELPRTAKWAREENFL